MKVISIFMVDGLFTVLRDLKVLIDDNVDFNWSMFYDLSDSDYSSLIDHLRENGTGSMYPAFDQF